MDTHLPSSLQGSEASDADSAAPDGDSHARVSKPAGVTLDGQALREWFHLPRYNRRDGLDDYDGDYRRFESLGQVVTAHLRHRMQRMTEAAPDGRCGPADHQCPQTRSSTPATGSRAPTAPIGERCIQDSQAGNHSAYASARSVSPRMLDAIRTAACNGAKDVTAIFCNGPVSPALMERLAKRWAEVVMVTDDRSTAASGPGGWLGALAMGASRIILIGLEAVPDQEDHLRLARTILAGLNLDPEARLLNIPEDVAEAEIVSVPAPAMAPAAWEPAGDERVMLWQAASHLHSQIPDAPYQTPLEPGAPFGTVELVKTRCTLCMACVGACPTDALQHGSPGPRIRFLERDCNQCGRCRQVCPEQAVTLTPRICYDPQLTGSFRILHQDTPLRCSVCGAPFATAGIVAAVSRKLSAHWMYQDPAAQGRLKMCRDCRIRSFFEAPPPAVREPGGRKK